MLKNYEVIARPNPTEAVPNPPAIRVQVFASDEIVAKSKFWTVASRIARLKPAHGEVLAVKQVLEPEPHRVKSYGIWLTFNSARGTQNIYKEVRDTTTEGAIRHLYQEMAGTHNVHQHQISIIQNLIQKMSNTSISSNLPKIRSNSQLQNKKSDHHTHIKRRS